MISSSTTSSPTTSSPKANRDRQDGLGASASLGRPRSELALPPVWARFFGYLSADGLTYLLGFAVYGWLIRILADRQYGQLSIATSIYQVLMIIGALGLDLTGPRLIEEAGGDPIGVVQRGERIRLAVSLGVCGPVTAFLAMVYWRRGHSDVAAVIVAGFAMVLSRTVDVSYLAVALGMPGTLARTRAFGLGLYLAALLVLRPVALASRRCSTPGRTGSAPGCPAGASASSNIPLSISPATSASCSAEPRRCG